MRSRQAPDSLRQAWFSDPPKAFALVAEADGELVGFATYYPTFSTFQARPGLWLDDLLRSARNTAVAASG